VIATLLVRRCCRYDLIIGRKSLSAIGTLVERTTNYTMLLHLPDGYTAEPVRDALEAKIKTLPDVLRASLTWDQGPEMRDWEQGLPRPPPTSSSCIWCHERLYSAQKFARLEWNMAIGD
jgi:hypothetical protein